MSESYSSNTVGHGVDYVWSCAGAPTSKGDQSHFLSRALEEFIAHEIGTLEQLEIILYFYQNPGNWWSATQVYEVVKSSVRSVQDRLTQFSSHKVLQEDGRDPPCYRANTENERLARVIAELDAHYHERRVRVVEFIYSRVPSGVTEFARAFRIQKEGSQG